MTFVLNTSVNDGETDPNTMSIGELKSVLAPLRRCKDSAMSKKKKELIARYLRWTGIEKRERRMIDDVID